MAIFPSAISTDSDLFVAVNMLSTQLTDNPLSNSATTVNVVDTTSFPSVGYISIDSEIIKYTAKTATSFTSCTRAADGSTAASHVQNSQVFHNVIAAHHNVLKDEIKAIETELGINGATFLKKSGGTLTGNLVLPAGSAGSPALSFSSGYGIFFDVGTDMKFAINGSSRLQIRESNGDIYCAYPVVGSSTSQTLGSASLYWGKLYTLGIKGTTTNDSASAGDVGEYVESVVTSGSAVTLTDATWTNITSISLTAGDWDVTSLAIFPLNGAGALSDFIFAVSAYSGATTTDHVVGDNIVTSPVNSTAGINTYAAIPARRFSLASTTTIYMKAFVDVASGAYKGYGRLSARRMR